MTEPINLIGWEPCDWCLKETRMEGLNVCRGCFEKHIRFDEREKCTKELEKKTNDLELEIMDLKDILLDLAPDYVYERKEWEERIV